MKSILAAALILLMSSAAFASENEGLESKPLSVSVSLTKNRDAVQINFVENEMSTAICNLAVSRLELTYPEAELLHSTPVGSIDINVKPQSVCLMALGKYYGSVRISIGEVLPALLAGSYALTINGVSYGFIQLHDDSVELLPTIPVLHS